MSNIVAIWGAPGSGKTTISISLATELYKLFKEEKKVCVVFSNGNVPVIPYVLQNEKINGVDSLGSLLTSDEINDKVLFKSLFTLRDMKDMGFFGYLHGETVLSYPKVIEANVRKFFELMSLLFDVVIVDVMSVPDDCLSSVTLNMADKIVTIVNPDVKSLSWYDSQVKPRFFAEFEKKNTMVMNHLDNYIYYPDSEVSLLCGGVKHIMPFSLSVRQENMDGVLIRGTKDKIYSNMTKMLTSVVEMETGNR